MRCFKHIMRQIQNSDVSEKYKKTCIVCHASQKLMFQYRGYYYYRCPSCSLVSTYPLPNSATIINHYRGKFKEGNYQLLNKYSKEYRRIYMGFIKILENGLKSQAFTTFKGLKVLDMGCFTGEFLKLLQEKGADVYGIELQEEAVKIATKKLPGRVFKVDVSHEALPDMKYDVITLLGVIEHVTDPIKLLKKSTDLLKKEGILMIQTPNSNSYFAKIMGKLWPPYSPVEHIHLFSKESLRFTLVKLGFTNITSRTHWKRLPVAYVYHMLQNFGPEFYKIARPFYSFLPSPITKISLPFYIGEMIVIARKQ